MACHDLIVVGGGIGGLYTFLRVYESCPSADILLLEASDRFGGKLDTVYDMEDGHPLYESTTWTIMSEHVRLLSLLDRCSIPVRKMRHILIRDGCRTEDIPSSTCFYENGVPVCVYPTTGFSAMVDRLLELLPADALNTGVRVHNVVRGEDGLYRVYVSDRDGRETIVTTRHVVGCCPPESLLAWSVVEEHPEISVPLRDSFHALDYLKIVVQRPTPIRYAGLEEFYIVSSGIFSRTITCPTDPRWLYLSYVIGHDATRLYHAWHDPTPEFEETVQKEWRRLFPSEPFPHADEWHLHYYPSANYYPYDHQEFRSADPISSDHKAMIMNISNPCEGFYVVGDYLSDYAGHTEGVLQSADRILGMLFEDFQGTDGIVPFRPLQSVLSRSQMTVDLRRRFRFVGDQDTLSSCVANTCASMMYVAMETAGLPPFIPSILYIYYNTRVMMGSEDKDRGSYYQALSMAIDTHGICPETMWPFDPARVFDRPPEECYRSARESRLRFRMIPVGLDPMTTPVAVITNHIQKHLLNGNPIMVSIRRHPLQWINRSGVLVDGNADFVQRDLLSEPVHDPSALFIHFHSIVLVGIDFRAEN